MPSTRDPAFVTTFSRMRILITGASGTIGAKLVPALEPEHELILLSRRAHADPRCRQVDVCEIDQVIAATGGADAIIHLAIATGHEGDYESHNFNSERFDANVKGTYNVFEAARMHGVKRVIHTSSLTVVWGYVQPEWVDGDAAARPVGTYALTKFLAEQIAQQFAMQHGIEVLSLRIPKPVDIDDHSTREDPILPQWIAFPDLIQAYIRGLSAEFSGFQLATIVGETSKRRWDLTRAEKLLGYQPTCNLESMGYTLRDEPTGYGGAGVVWGDG